MIRFFKILSLLFTTLAIGCGESAPSDLIIHNAKIYTVNNLFEIAEAMVIDSGKIVDIGPEHEILNKYTATKIIDAEKHPIYPGLIDAHCNFTAFANQLNKADTNTAFLSAEQRLLELGITSIDAIGLSPPQINRISQLQLDKRFRIKVATTLPSNKKVLEHYLKKGPYKTSKLNVNAFHFYIDDKAFNSGIDSASNRNKDLKLLKEYGPMLYKKDFQINTNCIGDSAIKAAIDIYGKTLKGINDKRWQIRPTKTSKFNDFLKFNTYTIIPSIVQNGNTPKVAEKLFLQNGMVIIGSDFPNKAINPFETFHGLTKNTSLKRKDVIRAMTIWPAISNFEENEKGSLEIGKSADFILLSDDILETKQENILKVKVFQTFINGENVFSQKK